MLVYCQRFFVDTLHENFNFAIKLSSKITTHLKCVAECTSERILKISRKVFAMFLIHGACTYIDLINGQGGMQYLNA